MSDAEGQLVTIYRKINDPRSLRAIAEMAPKATAPFGGNISRAAPRRTPTRRAEGPHRHLRVPSVEKAREAYESAGYQEALKALGDGAERDVRIVAGME